MKHLYTILVCVLLVGLLCGACSQESLPTQEETQPDKLVELNFSVTIPKSEAAKTRSFGETATIQSLYIVAFDENGYIVEYTRANVFPQTGNGEIPFRVVLHATTEKRILHFIANYPEASIRDLNFGSERDLIGRMEVSNGQDAYWQRVVLNDGVISDEQTSPKLKRVPLIRNFLKITVSSNAADFIYEGFTVIYTPSKGSVAPYNVNQGVFEPFVHPGEVNYTYQELQDARYRGYMPRNFTLEHTEVANPIFQTTPFYMYERPGGVENSTYILVKGRWRGATTPTYYKVDIVYLNNITKQPVYYNLLRNFHYHINVSAVSSRGKSTAVEAASYPAENNLSSSVDVSSLSNISNGISRLFVSYTDTTLVTSDAVTLRFKFYPNIQTNTTNNSLIRYHLNTDNDQLFTSSPIIAGSNTTDGWRTITFQPTTLPAGIAEMKQSVVLYSSPTAEVSGISRIVNFTLRRRYNLQLSCTPTSVAQSIGRPFALYINLPDELPATLFPISFMIESSANSIYPNPETEYMPTFTGLSIVTGKENVPSFGFVKSLTYEQYLALPLVNGQKRLTCNFKTNAANSTCDIYVYNKYFEKRAVTLYNR